MNIEVTTDLRERPWSDLDGLTYMPGIVQRIGFIPADDPDDPSTVAILIRTPSGQYVVGETTLGCFVKASTMMQRIHVERERT